MISLFHRFQRAKAREQVGLISSCPVALGIKAETLETGRFYPSYYYLPHFLKELHGQLAQDVQLVSLTELAQQQTRQVRPHADFPDEIIDFIQIGDVPPHLGRIANFERAIASDVSRSHAKMPLMGGHILLSRIRPTRGSIAIVPPDLDGAIGTDGFIVLAVDEKKIYREVLWLQLRSENVLRQLYCLQRYSGGYPRIDDADVSQIRTPVPTRETQQKIRGAVTQMQKNTIDSNKALHKAQSSLIANTFMKGTIAAKAELRTVAHISLDDRGKAVIHERCAETFSVCSEIKRLEHRPEQPVQGQ